MTRRLRLLSWTAAALAAALCAAPAAADTVRATSTTLFYTREDPYRVGGGSREIELDRVAPLFEMISVTASDVSTAFAEEVEVVLSTWGAYEIGDIRRWQNGASTASERRASGDVDVGYVKGELFGRRLIRRVGRQLISEGASRMVHVDGAQLRLRLPFGVGVSAYAGSVVPPRFAGRGGELMTGNHRADFATGGRLSWFFPGVLEVGASAALARDRGDVSRQDVGADLRLFLPMHVQLAGSSFYSLYEERLGEAEVAASWRGSRAVQVTADYRHVEPDLFLPRTSIFSVFAEDQRDDVGGSVRVLPVPTLAVDADYHYLFERGGNGHRARLKGVWSPRKAYDVGAEGQLLLHPDDAGYSLVRAFMAWRRGALEATADVLSAFLDRKVNEERLSLTATATAGYRFAPGWKVLLAGSGGTTPVLIRHFDVLAKLVYDQTYVTREVP